MIVIGSVKGKNSVKGTKVWNCLYFLWL